MFVLFVTVKERQFTKIKSLRERTRNLFLMNYETYLLEAFPKDELRPLTCDGYDTWGGYALTLIDSLSTLGVLGLKEEFHRVVTLIEETSFIDCYRNVNVSVFETNIRVIGGLISSHLLLNHPTLRIINQTSIDSSWPCSGKLLDVALELAERLLPAFDTRTGMPYGTVNLRDGVPHDETPITCLAGVGTFIVEFGTLSRLSGDDRFEKVAMRALDSLERNVNSVTKLFGNHINVLTGVYTASDGTIGAGVDSWLEYLVKGAILFNNSTLLKMFEKHKKSIDFYMKQNVPFQPTIDKFHERRQQSRLYYHWVNSVSGNPSYQFISSLDAYYPGILFLSSNHHDDEARSFIRTLFHDIWKRYGILPEYYLINTENILKGREFGALRPELIESIWYMKLKGNDEEAIDMAEEILYSIEKLGVNRQQCANEAKKLKIIHSIKNKFHVNIPLNTSLITTIKDCETHELDNRLESFVLAETLKYLYLIFDEEHWLNHKSLIYSSDVCPILGERYIMNTEAHPIDIAAVRCCHRANSRATIAFNYLLKMDPHQSLNQLNCSHVDDLHFAGEKIFEEL
ncbi:hypothetical protein SNEBB_000327 [Seison nebaliae]|nr:hypothetical protein SNEBB_000327 [Seison nebaliae]